MPTLYGMRRRCTRFIENDRDEFLGTLEERKENANFGYGVVRTTLKDR